MEIRASRVLLTGTGVLVLVFAVQAATGFGGRDQALFVRWFGGGLPFACAALCLLRAWSARAERWVWGLLGAGVLIWASGNAYYLLRLADLADPPFPSWADAGYVGFYPFAYASVVLLCRARFRGAPSSVWLDGLIGALSGASVVALLVFDVVVAATGGDPATVMTTLAAPLGDLLLLAVVVGTLSMGRRLPDVRFGVLAAGLVVFAVTDSVYVAHAASGTYEAGSFLDAGWVVGLFGLSAAACARGSARVSEPRAGALVLPAAFALVAVGVLGVGARDAQGRVAQLLAMAALLVVVVRMVWTMREHDRVLRQTRHESLTDELTGLGNRRALMLDLDAMIEACPVGGLVLLDLNGFKLYNDSFGHPAGDALLTRLAAKLIDALEGLGTAYRMGGDEFCVLVPAAALERATARSTLALAEHGDGFHISAAAGSASLPADAATAEELLRVADQRMYADKGGQRSPARQSAAVLIAALREYDGELDRHGESVAEQATALAGILGLSDGEVEEVHQTAELHDLGKMAIPDAILRKPGPLDEDEWCYIRTHTLIGERILLAAPALHKIGELVRSSHERWDGAGYPDGLAGARIPLPSRIVSVTDAFDAMTSDRPYRTAMDVSDALAELERCAGTAFDPGVVDAFKTMLAQRGVPTGGEAPRSGSAAGRRTAVQAATPSERAAPASLVTPSSIWSGVTPE